MYAYMYMYIEEHGLPPKRVGRIKVSRLKEWPAYVDILHALIYPGSSYIAA